MHESTTITSDGRILTWREYIDEQMALDADASEADEGIPFAVAECPPIAAYKSIITRGLARVAALLVVALVPLAFMMHAGEAHALTAEDGTQVGPHFYDPDADADGWRDAIDPLPHCPATYGPSHVVRNDYGRAECDTKRGLTSANEHPLCADILTNPTDGACRYYESSYKPTDQQATAEDGSRVPADYYDHVDLTPVCAAIGGQDARADCYATYPDQAPNADTAPDTLGYGAGQLWSARGDIAAGNTGAAYAKSVQAFEHMTRADYAKAYSRAPDALQHIMWRVASTQ